MKTNAWNKYRKDFTIHPRSAEPYYYDEGWTLDAVYNSYSYSKARAWDYCKEIAISITVVDYAL